MGASCACRGCQSIPQMAHTARFQRPWGYDLRRNTPGNLLPTTDLTWLLAGMERASQPYGPVRLPADPAVEQQPQPAVDEVTEAMPDALDLLHQQVDGHAPRGDRVGVLADPSARLGPGPLGQHRPGEDRGRPLVQVRIHRPAHNSARSTCATTAPPAGRRSASPAPAPSVGHAEWPARRSPRSR